MDTGLQRLRCRGGWQGRPLFLGVLALALFGAGSSVQAWGPRAHLEIAARLQPSLEEAAHNDFLAGKILPDFSLGMRYAGEDYPNLHALLHSDRFLQALRGKASTAFSMGWEAHLIADRVERDWSRQQRARGAPMAADWPVDTVFRPTAPIVHPRHLAWIQSALQDVGSDAQVPGHEVLNAIYTGYILLAANPTEHVRALEAWYSDYDAYIDRSVQAILERFAAAE